MFAGATSSDVVDMSGHSHVAFHIIKGIGTTGTSTITVESCDNVTPDTTTAIPFKYRKSTTPDVFTAYANVAAAGVATTAGSDEIYIVEVNSVDLTTTNQFVRLTLTEVADDPVAGAVYIELSGARESKNINDTVLT